MLLSALQSIEVPPEIPNSARSPECAKAALLYRAGRWDDAHNVVQDLEAPEGSFWHGIFHRAEPDWSNAAYWFRRVGQHQVYSVLHKDAAAILAKRSGAHWKLGTEWDPFLFINWCEEVAAHPEPELQQIVTDIQVAEWRRLFEWCSK